MSKPSEIEKAYEKLDEAVRYLCAAVNGSQVPEFATAVAHWSVLVDERYFKAGAYEGAGVYLVSKPEQPPYISKMLVERMYDQIAMGYARVEEDE